MKTTDIIRKVLDIVDGVEDNNPPEMHIDYVDNEPCEQPSRFKQILAMLQNRDSGGYANTPNEIVADVDAVTTDAGGGINGPKHPADIRVKDPGYGHGG